MPSGCRGFIIALDQLMPPLQQAGIALQLLQTYGGHDVRHVALIPRPHDVVFPRPQLGLGQSVLGLAVEAQQLIVMVQFLVVKTRQRAPRRCTASAVVKFFTAWKEKEVKSARAPVGTP